MFYKSRLLPMLMAEGGGAGEGSGEGAAPSEGSEGSAASDNGSNNGKQTSKEGNKPISFDDMLKQNDYQKEFDRKITQAVNTATQKERERLEALHRDDLTEVEKLAKMNEDEKEAYLEQKRQKELAKREAEITKRELTASAKDTLTEKGLPIELAGIVNLTSAEACKESIDTIEDTFKKAVEKAVEEKIKGGKPPKDAGTEGKSENDTLAQQVKEAFGVR